MNTFITKRISKQLEVVLLASGQGNRFGGQLPKQFTPLNGQPAIYYPLKILENLDSVDRIIVPVDVEYISLAKQLVEQHNFQKTMIIEGSSSASYLSLKCGLDYLRSQSKMADRIMISDAARIMITPDQITKLLDISPSNQLVGYYLPLSFEVVTYRDTPESLAGADDHQIILTDNLPREQIKAYHFPLILPTTILNQMHPTLLDRYNYNLVTAAQELNYNTCLIPGDRLALFKLTYPEDKILAEHLLAHRDDHNTRD